MADEEVLHAPKNQAGWTGTARAGVALPDAPGGEAVRAAETSHTGVLRAPLWPREGGWWRGSRGPSGVAERAGPDTPRGWSRVDFSDQRSWDSTLDREGGRSLARPGPSKVHSSGVPDRVSCCREVSKSHRDS